MTFHEDGVFGVSVSVVIPAYNSAEWLPSTLRSLAAALSNTAWSAEIIVVDDGSTDSTEATLESIREQLAYPLIVKTQSNAGVFTAVWEGIQAANNPYVLILNSRLILHEGSLAALNHAMTGQPQVEAWNGHVITDETSPLVGRFWEVPTYVFWGSYLSSPKPTSVTGLNFDKVPKGTGCFLVKKGLIEEAYRASWPAENARFTSDDTKLLRYIANKSSIALEPTFSATYRPRTTFRRFLGHSRGRGTLFVDSYAGTSILRNIVLIALVAGPPLVLVLLIAMSVVGKWVVVGIGFAALVALLLIPAIIALTRRCPPRAILSYLVFVGPFGCVFWTGLARGLFIHRKTLLAPVATTKGTKR